MYAMLGRCLGLWIVGEVQCQGGFCGENVGAFDFRVAGPASLWAGILYLCTVHSGPLVRAHTRRGSSRANDSKSSNLPKETHLRCDLNTNFGRAHQARRCCAASCKERFLASSSRRTDTSGGSWSTVCNTFTTGHVVMGVFIRLKARTSYSFGGC